MDMHQTMLTGNLGKDPEMRYSPEGNAVVNFSVASSWQYTANSGEVVKETCWTRITVWGKRAEACNHYLRKGSKVLVIGRLKPDKETGGPKIWTGQDGTVRSNFELLASFIQFLTPSTTVTAADGDDFGGGTPEEDIPF